MKTIKLTFFLFTVFAICGWAKSSLAATINAASCSQSNVQSAINSASNGDTVNIPACSATTWSSKITITKSINIIGAGIDQTIIVDGVSNDNLIEIGNGLSNGINPRLSGMTINGSASKSGFKAMLQIAGKSAGLGFRIDHIKFYHWSNEAIQTWDWIWGVVDHCTFYSTGDSAFYFRNDQWGGVGDYGDYVWSQPDDFGTEKFTFVEDCVFYNDSTNVTVWSDSDGGARYVYRHNTFYGGSIRAHGTDSGPRVRGTRAVEVYNNQFINNSPGSPRDTVYEWRSGPLIWYNNTISGSYGFDWGPSLRLNRNGGTTWWPPCDGSFPMDQNKSGLSGYLCLDQPGAGQSDYFSGGSGGAGGWTGITPYVWPHQVSSPVYMWNDSGYTTGEGGGDAGSYIQQNRDYFVGTPKPGYTPYTYPHPLVTGVNPPADTTPPASPVNLTVQ